jgi:short-subunit dehydrogenase
MSEFATKYGPVALIAGGSEGVGASYARFLAERGIDLVLVARKPEALEATRADLAARFPDRTITTIAADLTDPATPALLAEQTAGLEVGLLIYNAGSNWRNADFHDNDLAYAQTLTALNATTPMALAHHYGGLMRARGKGGIIIVGSFASFVGNPKLAIYSAAKAFATTLAEALWFELKPHGVDVLAHVIGSANTPFIARTFPQAMGQGEEPDDIARAGLAALGDGPVLRARGGDQFYDMLAGLPRAQAVTAAYEAGKAYHD